MVAKCANPYCDTPFKYLRGGKLFLFHKSFGKPIGENGANLMEYFWLCESCAAKLTIAIDKNGNTLTVRMGSV